MLRKVFVADSDAVISLWSLRPQAGVLPVGADAESVALAAVKCDTFSVGSI